MQGKGFPAVVTLGEAHVLLWDTVPARSKWPAVDRGQEITQLVQRKTMTHNVQQTFADLSVEDLLQVLVRKRYVTNTFMRSVAIDGNVVTSLTLAGLYLQSLGGTSYRIGVTDAHPVIAIQGGSNVTLQADATGTYTDQGASAQASDATTLSVGDAVNLTQITGGSPYVIVFSAVDAFGNLNSATRTVHVVDATNPTITANHLYIPTFSLNKKIENIVVNIGAAKEILTTVANGKLLRAIKIATKAINPEKHLKKCKTALFV